MADGKTSPFGNGRGGLRGGNVAGNDFTRNPQGGGGAGAARPRDLTKSQVQAPKAATNVSDLATDTVPEGGPLPFKDPQEDAGNPLGVGSLTGGRKPFTVGGG